MDDLQHAATFFLIFGLAVMLYGSALARTGNVELLPYRGRHAVRGPEDVKRVGRITRNVGLVIAGVALAMRLLRLLG